MLNAEVGFTEYSLQENQMARLAAGLCFSPRLRVPYILSLFCVAEH